MDCLADFLDRGDARRPDLPRFGIALDLDDVAAPTEGAVGVAPVRFVVPVEPVGTGILLRDDQRSVLRQILAWRSSAELAADLRGAPLQDLSDDHARSRRDGRAAVRNASGV